MENRLPISACMQEILKDYGYEAPTIKICEHMVNDLLSLLIINGYINQAVESEKDVNAK